MTVTPSAPQTMGFEATGGRSALDQVAALVTSPSICVDEDEMLVLALRPEHDNRRVIASAGNSAVRAAISVSIASTSPVCSSSGTATRHR